jgi:hypothetical protein
MGFFNGLFLVENTAVAGNQAFSESGNGNVLTVHRPNGEIVIDLGKEIATPANTNLVATQLKKAGASLTSAISVQGVQWPAVPYFFKDPFRHSFLAMLVEVYFNFEIETPWYCSNANGTLSVYLFLFLDSKGHLQGSADGWAYNYSGGGPFCTGAIDSGLNAAGPEFCEQINPVLAKALANAAGISFKDLYFLPGNGTNITNPPLQVQDASVDVAMGLLI